MAWWTNSDHLSPILRQLSSSHPPRHHILLSSVLLLHKQQYCEGDKNDNGVSMAVSFVLAHRHATQYRKSPIKSWFLPPINTYVHSSWLWWVEWVAAAAAGGWTLKFRSAVELLPLWTQIIILLISLIFLIVIWIHLAITIIWFHTQLHTYCYLYVQQYSAICGMEAKEY